MERPFYQCQVHAFIRVGNHWVMDMTVLVRHTASGYPAGTRGTTSNLLSIDFERGIAVTRNSIYQFNQAQ